MNEQRLEFEVILTGLINSLDETLWDLQDGMDFDGIVAKVFRTIEEYRAKMLALPDVRANPILVEDILGE